MQNKLDGSVLCVNDPAVHKPRFFRALAIAVSNGDLPGWKADELKREYNSDLKAGGK